MAGSRFTKAKYRLPEFNIRWLFIKKVKEYIEVTVNIIYVKLLNDRLIS